MDPEKKSLNGLFSLLNISNPKKFKPFSHWPSKVLNVQIQRREIHMGDSNTHVEPDSLIFFRHVIPEKLLKFQKVRPGEKLYAFQHRSQRRCRNLAPSRQ